MRARRGRRPGRPPKGGGTLPRRREGAAAPSLPSGPPLESVTAGEEAEVEMQTLAQDRVGGIEERVLQSQATLACFPSSSSLFVLWEMGSRGNGSPTMIAEHMILAYTYKIQQLSRPTRAGIWLVRWVDSTHTPLMAWPRLAACSWHCSKALCYTRPSSPGRARKRSRASTSRPSTAWPGPP